MFSTKTEKTNFLLVKGFLAAEKIQYSNFDIFQKLFMRYQGHQNKIIMKLCKDFGPWC